MFKGYKKSDIVSMTNEEILGMFYKLGAEEVKEVNFKSGRITNKTLRLKRWILEELENRFNVDKTIAEKETSL